MENNFFEENLTYINRMVCNIILSTTLVPFSFLFLSSMGLWQVPIGFSFLMLFISLSVWVIDSLLLQNEKYSIISMYLGLSGISLFILALGLNKIINVSIAFGIPPFVSCLYYNRKVTKRVSLFSYLVILISIFFRGFTLSKFVDIVGNSQTQIQWMLSSICGVSLEFMFVIIITNYLTRRTHNTLQNMITIQEQRDIAYNELKHSNDQLNETQLDIIEFVAQCLGSHDLFTGRHVMHTKKYVEIICRKLRENGHYVEILTDENIELFSSAAFLHDVGKIHIPEAILNKVGKFTDDEFALMKSHPEEGHKLLQFLPPIQNGLFNKIADEMAYCHHEKWDGSGYPRKLSALEIPLSARIMACADVLDALISQRLYKEPMSIEQAMDVFEKSSGSHFEPCIAQAVIDSRAEIEKEDKLFKDSENQSNAEELQWWLRYHANRNIS